LKVGIIYGIVNRKLGTIDYIGYHSNENLKERIKTHLSDFSRTANLPFYKMIIREAFYTTYKFIVIETFEYSEKKEL
jgi:hypothetical protein